MVFLYRLFFLGLTAVCVSLPLVSPVVAEDDKEIDRLVKQLGDDDFKKREAATKRLTAIGEPALDALQKATTSDDPEVALRAKYIVAGIENKLWPELILTGHKDAVWRVCVS